MPLLHPPLPPPHNVHSHATFHPTPRLPPLLAFPPVSSLRTQYHHPHSAPYPSQQRPVKIRLPPNVWLRILRHLICDPPNPLSNLCGPLQPLLQGPFHRYLPYLLRSLPVPSLEPVPRTSAQFAPRNPPLLLKYVASYQPSELTLPQYDGSMPDVHWNVLSHLRAVQHLQFVDSTRHSVVTPDDTKKHILHSLFTTLDTLVLHNPTPLSLSQLPYSRLTSLSLHAITPKAIPHVANFLTTAVSAPLAASLRSLSLSTVQTPVTTLLSFYAALITSPLVSSLHTLEVLPPEATPLAALSSAALPSIDALSSLLARPRAGNLQKLVLHLPDCLPPLSDINHPLASFLRLSSPSAHVQLLLPSITLHYQPQYNRTHPLTRTHSYAHTFISAHSLLSPHPMYSALLSETAHFLLPPAPSADQIRALHTYLPLSGANMRTLHLHHAPAEALIPSLSHLLPGCPNVEEITLPAEILHFPHHIPSLIGLLPRLKRLYLRRQSALQLSSSFTFGNRRYMPLLKVLVGQLWRCTSLKALAVDWDYIDGENARLLSPLLNAVVKSQVDVNGLDELIQAMAAS